MKSSDRAILIVLPLLAAVVGLWLLVISPKRSEAGDLQDKVDSIQSQVDAADQQVAVAETARKSFDDNYAALIDLGAAAPADGDQATLVYDLSTVATKNSVRFGGFKLAATEADAAAAPAPTTTDTGTTSTDTTSTDTTGTTGSTTATTTSTTTDATATGAAPATEAAAATLPIGSAVGPAGLPVSSYTFNLTGRFFDATDFLADLDKSVEASATKPPVVHGRLLTIDGFSFGLAQLDDFPNITANFTVTAYNVPADQGLDAGATPAGPAPVGTTTDSTATTTAPAATVAP